MTVTLKRQLTETEKQHVLARDGRKCFATGHEIPSDETVQYDHIHAFVKGGPSEIDNIAPMCETHNKQKGTYALADFRTKLRMNAFFSSGDSLTLKDLLAYSQEQGDVVDYGQKIQIETSDHTVNVLTHSGATLQYALYACPITGWQYFYATLPIALLDSDDEDEQSIGLQPRYLIQEKVFELYRHFQSHPVLQPSIGRIANRKIVLFDGQHKAAALLWNDRKEFECKIYLQPVLRLLNETNISAHDKYTQTRFYSSIMVKKLGKEFGAEFEEYKQLEDGKTKSEAGFMEYLQNRPESPLSAAERNQRFRSYLYNSVLTDENNRATPYVSSSNRSTLDKPLTIDMMQKSILAAFLYRYPVTESMTTEEYRRDKEVANVVDLMNDLVDLALGSWNPEAGANNENQRKLRRIFGSKSMMAWSEILRDAVAAKLDIHDADEKEKLFYRELSSTQREQIRKIVERLMAWSQWQSPANDDIDRVTAGNKGDVKNWFRSKGLTTGYLMGAPE
jgi:hypothetical protein